MGTSIQSSCFDWIERRTGQHFLPNETFNIIPDISQAGIIAETLLTQNFEVCITSYEICLIEKHSLKKFAFAYIVIDEAHRIKNVDSILSQIVRMFMSRGRLLITGTPLQNNLKELFALLNFICPEIFTDYADLEAFLHKDDGEKSDVSDETSRKVVDALHKILRPFLLRRVKADVEKSLLPSMMQLTSRALRISEYFTREGS